MRLTRQHTTKGIFFICIREYLAIKILDILLGQRGAKVAKPMAIAILSRRS